MSHVINIYSGMHTAVERTEAYKALVDSIRKIPQLQPEQERRILSEYLNTTDNNRKIELRNLLINANQTFVLAAVKQTGHCSKTAAAHLPPAPANNRCDLYLCASLYNPLRWLRS